LNLHKKKITIGERTLYRIKACMNFTTNSGIKIKVNDLGGFVEKK